MAVIFNSFIQTLCELSNDFLCILNLDGTIQFINTIFSKSLNYEPSVLNGTSFIQLLHPDDRPLISTKLTAAKTNHSPDSWEFVGRCQSKNKRFQSIQWKAAPQDEHLILVGKVKSSPSNILTDFQTIFEVAPIPVLIYDDRAIITYANSNSAIMFGYQSHELTGHSVSQLFPSLHTSAPISANELPVEIDPASRQRKFDVQGVHQTGRKMSLAINLASLELPDDKLTVAFISDAPRSAQIAQVLQETREQLQSFQNFHNLFVIRTDLQGNYTYVNDAMHQHFAWMYNSKEKMLGESSLNTIAEEDHPKTLAAVAQCLQTPQVPVQVTLRKPAPEGGLHWYLWDFVGVTASEGDVTEIQCMGIDITEMVLSQAELRESEARYRSLFDNTLDAIFLADNSARYIYVNPAACEMLGFSKSELLEKSVWDITPLPNNEVGRQLWAEFIQDGKGAGEYNLETNHGRTLTVEYRAVANVQPNVHLSVIRDVTERYALTQQLNKSLEAVKQSNQELERFAHVTSHDLKQPLRTVSSFVDLFRSEYSSVLDNHAQQYLHFISQGTEQMTQLINDLLEYSRVTSQGGSMESVDMNRLVNDTLLVLHQQIIENQSSIQTEQLPSIRGDATQLQQLLQNLISNSIKFRRESPPEIYISVHEDEEAWTFAVQDNGIGIGSSDFEQVFEPFQRLHTQDSYEGSGIGLAICKRIVERHQGKLWIESQLGVGTTFYFTIPKH